MKTLTMLLILFVSAASVVAQSPAPAPGPSAVPTLRPGDALRITVLRHPELSGEFVVTADGTLVHPVYRELRVSGMALSEADAAVRTLLTRFETKPEFVLDPLFQVAVSGEVRAPNLYALRPSTTIAQAVALAGGATERGRIERVRLFRGGAEFVVDLSRPERGLGMEPIQSGDQLLIERKTSLFRDYIAPAGSVVAALAAVLNIMIN
jgi:polysaccharide export outer membrane protein